MRSLKVQYTHEATHDLDLIWDYTEEVWSLAQTEAYVSTLRRTIDTLVTMPEVAREHLDLSPPMRMHPSGQHLVFYTLEPDALTIVRILGQRQKIALYSERPKKNNPAPQARGFPHPS